MTNSAATPVPVAQINNGGKEPLPGGLRLYLLYMFAWTAISAYLAVNLAFFAIRVSPSFINDDGNGLALALGVAAVMMAALVLWLIIQGLQAVIACGLAFRRSRQAPGFLKAASLFILAAGIFMGLGCTEVGRRLSAAGLDSHLRDFYHQTLKFMKYGLEILIPFSAAGFVYLARSVAVRRCFGVGGPERVSAKEPRPLFILITSFLILAIYKEALSLWSLASYILHYPEQFFFWIKVRWVWYLVDFALTVASLAAAVAGLAWLKKEEAGEGGLPAALAVVTVVQLVYLGFSLYNLVRFSHSKFVGGLYAGGLLALAEAAGFVFLTVKVVSRRRKIAEYGEFIHNFRPGK